MSQRKQGGFTLIEMIVVIVIIGLLAAAALPRFSRIDTAAHRSAVTGAAAAFRTAVILVRTTYLVRGYTGAVDDVAGFGNNTVDVNTAGYPTDTSGSNTVTGTATCQRVWNGILDGAPTTTTTTSTAFDYRVTVSVALQRCIYTYLRSASPARSITYNALTGTVTVINP